MALKFITTENLPLSSVNAVLGDTYFIIEEATLDDGEFCVDDQIYKGINPYIMPKKVQRFAIFCIV